MCSEDIKLPGDLKSRMDFCIQAGNAASLDPRAIEERLFEIMCPSSAGNAVLSAVRDRPGLRPEDREVGQLEFGKTVFDPDDDELLPTAVAI